MVWKTINEILNKQTKKKTFSKEFTDMNSTDTVNDSVEIANKFNDYFVNYRT